MVPRKRFFLILTASYFDCSSSFISSRIVLVRISSEIAFMNSLKGLTPSSPAKRLRTETVPEKYQFVSHTGYVSPQKTPEVLLDFPGIFPYFIKSAMVTLSRYSLTRRFSSLHMGRVLQSAVCWHWAAPHSGRPPGPDPPR